MIPQAITHFTSRTRLAMVIVSICLAAMIGTPVDAADPATPQPPPTTGYLPSNRLGRAHPVADDIPLQDMIDSVTQQPFADLEQAIKSKDQAAFSKAYSDLTSGCNACHQATNHGVIVIKVPKAASVFDLDLTPTSP